MDQNAQFLNDIHYFKDSIGIIVSHASRRENTPNAIKKSIKIMLEKHDNLKDYKETVSYIL